MRQINFQGWDNAIEMQNAYIRIVIVPQIGRIMFFGPVHGPNLMWIHPRFRGKLPEDVTSVPWSAEAEWANFGGDKVWPVEQFRWPEVNGRAWPPDPWFDGSPHAFEIEDHAVTLISPVSRFCGARIIRKIRMGETESQIRIEQKLEKVKPGQNRNLEPIPLTIWSVTQTIKPDEILFPIHPESRLPDPVFIYDANPVTASNVQRRHDLGILFPSESEHQKIGTDGDGWLAAVCGSLAFAQRFKREADAPYPEEGLSAEVYTAPGSYIELEVLSPLYSLKIGESCQSTLVWELVPLVSEDRNAKRSEIKGRME